ncbi:TetR family transcriptional regulator [Kaistia sp. 32K]|uniref:TetR/AcrR family transcriptional regulator n=1 Tax=Kaistia sp. 32K TaxID=2795690 RepID=UPI0019154CC0|nr:TetR/AcrR family transcriptional regulator [Kaistia sp. 32K]BCP55311.1 TetR family transcriptional regulator [Kaistia sp. 32K]
MGTSQEKKAASRQAIVAAAARLFRERGIDGVTVAEVMEAAGLTHGGFPRHFASKQELVTETMAAILDPKNRPADRPIDLEAFAELYLRPEHCDSPGQGCVFAALGPEMARAPGDTRHVLTGAMRRQIELFAQTAPGDDERERRVAAIGSWSAMIGAMVLARIADSEELSKEILEATDAFLRA